MLPQAGYGTESLQSKTSKAFFFFAFLVSSPVGRVLQSRALEHQGELQPQPSSKAR